MAYEQQFKVEVLTQERIIANTLQNVFFNSYYVFQSGGITGNDFFHFWNHKPTQVIMLGSILPP